MERQRRCSGGGWHPEFISEYTEFENSMRVRMLGTERHIGLKVKGEIKPGNADAGVSTQCLKP